MHAIQLKNIQKSYGNHEVVKSLSFNVRSGERLVILGPSGCGKSTTLRMIAGLESITDGQLIMGETVMNDVDCGKRNVAMVFQNYSLYPHMSVKKNITYGLAVKKVPKKEINKRLSEVLTMLELNGLENRLPRDLSGGQRQRVALARAIVKQSDYFLLDEPLSNLDAQLRVSARKELVKIHDTFQQTMVYVTHDQVEAMAIGHRIAILNQGELQMIDTPENVYHRPKNTFTAKFIGSPSMNLAECDYHDGCLHFQQQQLKLDNNWVNFLNEKRRGRLIFGFRPEHFSLSYRKENNALQAIVQYVENYGENYGVHLEFESKEFVILSNLKHWIKGDTVYMVPNLERIHLFNKLDGINIDYPNTLKENDLPLQLHEAK